jgi:hypothetical protein
VTEEQWLASADPLPMLGCLKGRTSARKLRLLACAFCRRIWDRIPAGRFRAAVEAAEGFADGTVTGEELRQIRQALGSKGKGAKGLVLRGSLLHARRAAARAACTPSWSLLPDEVVRDTVREVLLEVPHRQVRERREQAGLLRDVFGNPFRPAAVDPAWLAWNSAAAVRLARAAYDERDLPGGNLDNTRLAVLADALEEAGCQDPAILGHLRSGGEHVLGCYVVDALLGKS